MKRWKLVSTVEKVSKSLQVRESSVLDSYHRKTMVSSLDASHGIPRHPPACDEQPTESELGRATALETGVDTHTHIEHAHTHGYAY